MCIEAQGGGTNFPPTFVGYYRSDSRAPSIAAANSIGRASRFTREQTGGLESDETVHCIDLPAKMTGEARQNGVPLFRPEAGGRAAQVKAQARERQARRGLLRPAQARREDQE
jgi:hypothetical protein